jgi:hypothetical protein
MKIISEKIVKDYSLFETTFSEVCTKSWDTCSWFVFSDIVKYVYPNAIAIFSESSFEIITFEFSEKSLIKPFEKNLENIEKRIEKDMNLIFENVSEGGNKRNQIKWIKKYANGLKKEFNIKD